MKSIDKCSWTKLALPSIALLLSSCAVSTPATIVSTQGSANSVGAIEFVTVPSEGTLQSQWRSALIAAFAKHSVASETGSNRIADFSLSIRQSESGIADASSSPDDIDWQSSPKSGRFIDSCKAKRLRGSLVIFKRDTGEVAYRGESEADGCDFDEKDFAQMASVLAVDALN